MKKSYIFPLVVFIVVGIVYLFINIFGIFNKSYKTIELAIENSELRGNEVIIELESNDFVYALIGKDGSSQWKYFYKDKSGWKYIFSKIDIPSKVIIKRNYDLTYRRYRSKHIINISINEKYNEALVVRDSVNSNFKTYKSDNSKDYFLVFDKLPEDYIIYIGEYKFKIN